MMRTEMATVASACSDAHSNEETSGEVIEGSSQALGRARLPATLFHLMSAALDRLDGLHADPDREEPQYTGFLFRHWAPIHVKFIATGAVPDGVS
jgi:hypothetical protein